MANLLASYYYIVLLQNNNDYTLPQSSSFIEQIKTGDFSAIARAITIIENGLPGYEELLEQCEQTRSCKVVGITGPPGAGKSTLINGMLHHMSVNNKVALLSVDPSSPFNFGALLGDRIRMADFYLNQNVYIRSLASRGSLGGLSASVFMLIELLKSSVFDYILIETVGVGQSEVEISGIADTTVVVLVPEAGDEVQTMKAGLMEIADIFVVNKADRSKANEFVKNLSLMVHENSKQDWQIPVLKCIATEGEGIPELLEAIQRHSATNAGKEKHIHFLVEKAYSLISHQRMRSISKEDLASELKLQRPQPSFNLMSFVLKYNSSRS